MHSNRRILRSVAALAAASLGLVACSGDDAAAPADAAPPAVTDAPETTITGAPETTITETTITDAPETTITETTVADAPETTITETTIAEVEVLTIVLSNDDGVDEPALDVLLALLLDESDVEVTVVVPAEDRSGTSDNVTEGGVEYREAITPAGVPAYAVEGFPADSVLVALDELDLTPHLVVSGINPGQNIGPFAALSGTVGVARTAIRRGYPALAVSAALQFDEEQFVFAANLALDWIRENRESLVTRTHQTDTVTSLNVPACAVTLMGPLVEVPLGTAFPDEANPFESTCDQSDAEPASDVIALIAGYPTITAVQADLDDWPGNPANWD